MNKTLDIKRMGMVLRWDILTYWKTYMFCIVGCIIAFSLFSIWELHQMSQEKYYLDFVYFALLDTFFRLLFTLAFYVMAASIFCNMKDKINRESYLMLPANNIEKYMMRFLLMTIGCVAGSLLVLFATDVIQWIFSFILAPGFHVSISLTIIEECIRDITCEGRYISTPKYITIVCLVIFNHSFCTLGGAFYRKRPALLTIVSNLILWMLIGYATKVLSGNSSFFPDLRNDYPFAIAFSLFILALSAFNYWASYKIFTRMQVICNKWINI